MKLCTVCGVVTSRAGSRCTEHTRQSNRSRHNALYSTRAWQRLSARVLRAWRGERGNWCPGYQRPAHRAADLTVDHVVPLAAGGAPFDIANTAVLCRGVVTSRAGSRCTEHARQSNRSRHNALYSTRAWQRLSARVLRALRGERGNWCPGYQRPAHRASDLTVDHVVPLAAGGAPFDITNCAVLCRSCNSTKGASVDAERGGVAHMPPRRTLTAPRDCVHAAEFRQKYQGPPIPDPPTLARGRHRWPTCRDEQERGH